MVSEGFSAGNSPDQQEEVPPLSIQLPLPPGVSLTTLERLWLSQALEKELDLSWLCKCLIQPNGMIIFVCEHAEPSRWHEFLPGRESIHVALRHVAEGLLPDVDMQLPTFDGTKPQIQDEEVEAEITKRQIPTPSALKQLFSSRTKDNFEYTKQMLATELLLKKDNEKRNAQLRQLTDALRGHASDLYVAIKSATVAQAAEHEEEQTLRSFPSLDIPPRFLTLGGGGSIRLNGYDCWVQTKHKGNEYYVLSIKATLDRQTSIVIEVPESKSISLGYQLEGIDCTFSRSLGAKFEVKDPAARLETTVADINTMRSYIPGSTEE